MNFYIRKLVMMALELSSEVDVYWTTVSNLIEAFSSISSNPA